MTDSGLHGLCPHCVAAGDPESVQSGRNEVGGPVPPGRPRRPDAPVPPPPPPTEEVEEWKVVCGKFLAINSTNMSCACPRSPRGLSPAAHLGDGSCDLILIRKCSRFNFLRFLVRHTNQCDQVGAGRPCAPAPT